MKFRYRYLKTRLTGVFLLFGGFAVAQQPKLYPHPIHLEKGVDLKLNLPEGYHISVAAEGMKRLRFMAKAPDGRLFATDMYNMDDNNKGKVYIFEGWDANTKRFARIITFAENLHNPNHVAFYSTGGKHFIYIAETHQLTRHEYTPGSEKLTGPGQVIATFPDYGLSYKYGGWHLTRSLAFHNDKLYVSVGSSCNACIEKESVRASIIEMNPDGSDKKTYASGLRNSVGMEWLGDQLWVTSMGRDLIGPDKPEELFHLVERGRFYGWPYYIQYKGVVLPDKAMQDSARKNGIKIPPKPRPAWCGFKAHSAPLGLEYMHDFSDPLLKNSFLVALHGSTSVWRMRGNAIVKVAGKDKYYDIVNGFLEGKEDKDRKGRPCDVLMNDERSFFFTDDLNGVLYYVWR
jgi:glucose/arabinose dehydrogenase